MKVDPDRIREFKNAAAFERWLAKHHATEPEVWIKIHKKGSGLPTISPLEAIDIVLCWGWIDAIRKGLDETSFLQRYTPRRAKSVWSQINRKNVARLVAEGRMTEHGLKHVEAAKADGRWEAAYAAGSEVTTPPDLLKAIRAVPEALATFKTLNRQNVVAMAYRLHLLKTPAGRAKRITTFVEMLARGETLHPNGKR